MIWFLTMSWEEEQRQPTSSSTLFGIHQFSNHYLCSWIAKLCSSCAVYLASLPCCCFLLTDDLFGTKLSCLFVLAASFLSTISGSLTELGRSGILGGGVYLVTLSFSFTKSIKYKNPSCTYISTTSCLYEPLSVRSGILELGPLEGNQGYWQSHT